MTRVYAAPAGALEFRRGASPTAYAVGYWNAAAPRLTARTKYGTPAAHMKELCL